jgi:lipopolysaccharide export system permease protein
MKKLDKLVLSSFLGPFILTFLVVVFILLMQHMLKYFDDIIGKGLGIEVIGQLLFYFAIFMTPIAMPLAVLLSSLIAFGNLGEHFELTAIKSAGISLVRTILPIFYFVLLLTGIAFYVNNNLVPKAALEAYSLLYDIKQKKPALDLREGAFYNGIPDISIKVNEKFPDGITLKDVIIYDHRKHDGNKDVTIADSGKMYTILNERYLKLELFKGYNYTEGAGTSQDITGKQPTYNTETFSRSKFAKTQVVFDLSSFQLARTDKKWFQGNRIMRNLYELDHDLDSLRKEGLNYQLVHYSNYYTFFNYFNRQDSIDFPVAIVRHKRERDSLSRVAQEAIDMEYRKEQEQNRYGIPQESMDTAIQIIPETIPAQVPVKPALSNPSGSPQRGRTLQQKQPSKSRTVYNQKGLKKDTLVKKKLVLTDSMIHAKIDSVFVLPVDKIIYTNALNKARSVKSNLASTLASMEVYRTDARVFRIQWHKILASSFACIAMFLIGAPLGAIIKKGGLGVPFLVSILFFIVYYLLTMTGEKWAKQGIIGVEIGVWAADLILLVIGMFFLRQARLDARLFEADFYQVVMEKVSRWVKARRNHKLADTD